MTMDPISLKGDEVSIEISRERHRSRIAGIHKAWTLTEVVAEGPAPFDWPLMLAGTSDIEFSPKDWCAHVIARDGVPTLWEITISGNRTKVPAYLATVGSKVVNLRLICHDTFAVDLLDNGLAELAGSPWYGTERTVGTELATALAPILPVPLTSWVD
jgi:hypothetical protein